MVGGAVAMKIGGMPGLHKSPPLILAADGPSKIAPPNEATVQSAGDTGALLLKDSAAPTPSPVKLVSTEEQPVDLLAQTPAPAPKPPAADAQSAPAPKPPAADAQSAPAPKSPAADGQLAPCAQHAYRRAVRGPGRRAGLRSHAVPLGQEGQNCFGPSGRDIDLVGYGP